MNNDDPPFKELSAIVRVPGSKSLTQRALVAAALARDNSFIGNALVSEDTLHLIDGLRALGANILSAFGGFFVPAQRAKLPTAAKKSF